MSLSAYIKPPLRWWRLIVIVTVLAMSASAVSTMFEPDLYESKTTLVVGTTFLDPNPSSGQIGIAQQLAQIYADMARREPIQIATKEALGVNWLPSYRAAVVPNTQIVEISVTDTNPRRAQIVANEIANQLKLQSPTIGDTETGAQQVFIKEQLSILQNQIQETEREIEELRKSLVGLNSASQIAETEKKITEQTQKLDSLRTNYAGFLANSQGGAVNILSVVEPAPLPGRPIGSNRVIIVILAGLVGFSLGTGAAYLLEYLDKSIKTTSDVERVFKLPVIGYISEISDDKSRTTYVAKNPESVIAENFHLLHSNIEFFRISNPIKTIVITSPSQGNGKTTVAANLAITISREDRNVVLVDADLKRPMIHKSLKMPKGPGLCDVLSNEADTQSVVRSWKGDNRLKIITAGNKPSKCSEVTGSKKISAFLSQLKEDHELVIIDAPPLIVASSYNLASEAEGVIIVMEPGLTTVEQANAIKEQLDRAKAKIIGIVFNKMSEERAYSYGDYQYRSLYSPSYYGDYISKTPSQEPATRFDSNRLLDFFEYGKFPIEVPSEIQKTITTKKTRSRNVLERIRKAKRNGKNDD